MSLLGVYMCACSNNFWVTFMRNLCRRKIAVERCRPCRRRFWVFLYSSVWPITQILLMLSPHTPPHSDFIRRSPYRVGKSSANRLQILNKEIRDGIEAKLGRRSQSIHSKLSRHCWLRFSTRSLRLQFPFPCPAQFRVKISPTNNVFVWFHILIAHERTRHKEQFSFICFGVISCIVWCHKRNYVANELLQNLSFILLPKRREWWVLRLSVWLGALGTKFSAVPITRREKALLPARGQLYHYNKKQWKSENTNARKKSMNFQLFPNFVFSSRARAISRPLTHATQQPSPASTCQQSCSIF